MKTERFEPGNVVPTAVIPTETAVLAGICDKALIWDGVATTTVCSCRNGQISHAVVPI